MENVYSLNYLGSRTHLIRTMFVSYIAPYIASSRLIRIGFIASLQYLVMDLLDPRLIPRYSSTLRVVLTFMFLYMWIILLSHVLIRGLFLISLVLTPLSSLSKISLPCTTF